MLDHIGYALHHFALRFPYPTRRLRPEQRRDGAAAAVAEAGRSDGTQGRTQGAPPQPQDAGAVEEALRELRRDALGEGSGAHGYMEFARSPPIDWFEKPPCRAVDCAPGAASGALSRGAGEPWSWAFCRAIVSCIPW